MLNFQALGKIGLLTLASWLPLYMVVLIRKKFRPTEVERIINLDLV